MTGAKALTASSGPGLSLYSENIGLAQMGEAPLVIVNCQRMGPATGGATATGEGEVLFARHVTSGGYPLPVLAATDAGSAYRLTYLAFNIAERLRTPVIVLLSKDISMTRQTVDLDAIPLAPQVERRAAGENGPFKPYAIERSADVPAFAPIGGPRRVRFTGSIHDENGVLTTNRERIAAKLAHLRDKIDRHAADLELVREDLQPEARTLLISYGLADGACLEAVARLRRAGTAVSHLTLYSLFPVPERAVRRAVGAACTHILVPELNIGLYVEELRRIAPGISIESLVRFDGGVIHPRTIVDAVQRLSREGKPCPC
jgi:2-oxoglutarate ferredoxin oxidoreductase subunit alpha